MRICTWNVNSVRIRLDHVMRLLEKYQPDVLCLQEIKVINELFPEGLGEKLGYCHRFIHGQKAYHGVAILSRLPIVKAEPRYWCGKEDSRHAWASVKCKDGKTMELHNFYVPAGGDIPNPDENDKFAHKLQFLAEMADWFGERRKKSNRFVLMGDLNVAPLESDVWSHKQLLKVVSHTPVEVEALNRVYESHDWSMRCAILCPRMKSSIHGGATGHAIGPNQTVAAVLTIFGSPRHSKAPLPRQRSSPRYVVGKNL